MKKCKEYNSTVVRSSTVVRESFCSVVKYTRRCTYLCFQLSSEDHCSSESYYYQSHDDDGLVVHCDVASLWCVGHQDAHSCIALALDPNSVDSEV
jgi:hypothetical protein